MENLGLRAFTKQGVQLKAERVYLIILPHFEDLEFEGDITYYASLLAKSHKQTQEEYSLDVVIYLNSRW